MRAPRRPSPPSTRTQTGALPPAGTTGRFGRSLTRRRQRRPPRRASCTARMSGWGWSEGGGGARPDGLSIVRHWRRLGRRGRRWGHPRSPAARRRGRRVGSVRERDRPGAAPRRARRAGRHPCRRGGGDGDAVRARGGRGPSSRCARGRGRPFTKCLASPPTGCGWRGGGRAQRGSPPCTRGWRRCGGGCGAPCMCRTECCAWVGARAESGAGAGWGQGRGRDWGGAVGSRG